MTVHPLPNVGAKVPALYPTADRPLALPVPDPLAVRALSRVVRRGPPRRRARAQLDHQLLPAAGGRPAAAARLLAPRLQPPLPDQAADVPRRAVLGPRAEEVLRVHDGLVRHRARPGHPVVRRRRPPGPQPGRRPVHAGEHVRRQGQPARRAGRARGRSCPTSSPTRSPPGALSERDAALPGGRLPLLRRRPERPEGRADPARGVPAPRPGAPGRRSCSSATRRRRWATCPPTSTSATSGRTTGWSRASSTPSGAVLPSVWPDPCPTTVLEAMALGTPIVTTPMGGIADMVTDGESALVVAPGDVDATEAALRRLVAEPALRAAWCRRPGSGCALPAERGGRHVHRDLRGPAVDRSPSAP